MGLIEKQNGSEGGKRERKRTEEGRSSWEKNNKKKIQLIFDDCFH